MSLPEWIPIRPLHLPSLANVAAAASGTKVLNFVMQNRQQTAWSAQAVAASISMFYSGASAAKSQCAIANSVFGLTTCCNSSPPSGCMASTTLSGCVQATGNYSSGTSATASTSQVTAAIDAGTPIGVTLSSGYVAIYGYTTPGTGAWIYYIADPANGYSVMNSSIFPSQYFGGATWTYTVYTKA